MGIAFSNFDAGHEMASEVQGDSCTGTCSSSLNRIFNIEFSYSGSAQETELFSGSCRTLEDGECDEQTSECRWSWMSNDPS